MPEKKRTDLRIKEIKKGTPCSSNYNGVESGVGRAAKLPYVNLSTSAVLRPADAAIFLAISRTKLHFLHECDPTFPRKIIYSVRCVGFLKESLKAWLSAKEREG